MTRIERVDASAGCLAGIVVCCFFFALFGAVIAGTSSVLAAQGGGVASSVSSAAVFAISSAGGGGAALRDPLRVAVLNVESAAVGDAVTRGNAARLLATRVSTGGSAGVGGVERSGAFRAIDAGFAGAARGARTSGAAVFAGVGGVRAVTLRGAGEAFGGSGVRLRGAGGSVGGGTLLMSASVVCAAKNHDRT